MTSARRAVEITRYPPAAFAGPDPRAAARLTVHQQMIAEIEAALCATDPAVATIHVRLANGHARRFTDRAISDADWPESRRVA